MSNLIWINLSEQVIIISAILIGTMAIYVFGGSNREQAKFFNTCEHKYLHQFVNKFTHRRDDAPYILNLNFIKNPLEIDTLDLRALIEKKVTT